MTILVKKKVFFSAYVMFLSILVAVFFGLIMVSGAGCNDDTNTINNVSNERPSNNNVSAGFYNENTSGDNTLILTEAKFVVRQLRLKQQDGEDHNVNLGPFVVYLDMRQDVIIVGIARIPAGVYDQIKFQIHKPTPQENISDPDFAEGNSRRFSVVTKGFYNNVPFVFKSDVTVAKGIDFENSPVTITSSVLVNLTIRLYAYEWFMNNGALIDPTDENNRNIIKQNIKNSFRRAFRDIDLNGEPD